MTAGCTARNFKEETSLSSHKQSISKCKHAHLCSGQVLVDRRYIDLPQMRVQILEALRIGELRPIIKFPVRAFENFIYSCCHRIPMQCNLDAAITEGLIPLAPSFLVLALYTCALQKKTIWKTLLKDTGIKSEGCAT